MFGELGIPITVTKVRNAIKQIKSNNSGGPDKVIIKTSFSFMVYRLIFLI